MTGLGLRHDLALIERRAALGWLGGATFLAACGRTGAAATLAAGDCAATPPETRGPYPADGTASWGGRVPNVLEHSGILRSDIRSNLGSTDAAAGVPVELHLTVVDANAACAPLAGHVVYLWQCDRDGRYSLYDLPQQSWLRGVQATDGRGEAVFTTIFPAAYIGRYPHMHFEVFRSLADARGGRPPVLVSQLLMPAETCRDIYARAPGYERSREVFSTSRIDRDSVLRDNNDADIAMMTPRFAAADGGYRAQVSIGIA